MQTPTGTPLDVDKYTNPLNFTDISDTVHATNLLRRANEQIVLSDLQKKMDR